MDSKFYEIIEYLIIYLMIIKIQIEYSILYIKFQDFYWMVEKYWCYNKFKNTFE
jgi:hypothetical protein